MRLMKKLLFLILNFMPGQRMMQMVNKFVGDLQRAGKNGARILIKGVIQSQAALEFIP